MLISVVICTRDRPDRLAQVLHSATRLVHPGPWELVVVDNDSDQRTDSATAQIVDDHVGLLPIRRIIASMPGLSHARNAGIDAVRGDYVCWTDDDVMLDPNWLAAYAAAFRRTPSAAIFGGPIEPDFGAAADGLLARHAGWWAADGVCARRCVSNAMPLDAREAYIPWGANYAVRTLEQRAHRYDSELGKAPGRRRLGEETDVLRRILATGATGRWVADACVRHVIAPERQTLAVLDEHCRAAGETAAYLRQRGGAGLPPADGVQKLAARSTPRLHCAARAHAALAAGTRSIKHRAAAGLYRGIIDYRRRQRAETA